MNREQGLAGERKQGAEERHLQARHGDNQERGEPARPECDQPQGQRRADRRDMHQPIDGVVGERFVIGGRHVPGPEHPGEDQRRRDRGGAPRRVAERRPRAYERASDERRGDQGENDMLSLSGREQSDADIAKGRDEPEREDKHPGEQRYPLAPGRARRSYGSPIEENRARRQHGDELRIEIPDFGPWNGGRPAVRYKGCHRQKTL